jgi:hypothetical protein
MTVLEVSTKTGEGLVKFLDFLEAAKVDHLRERAR